MKRNVFISHSSEDAKIAQQISSHLEKNDIKCWIAPRDIRPGLSYDEEIIDGIENSNTLILILSNNSNESDHVKREIELAVDQKHSIFPIRIENIEPSKKLKYYLIGKQWLDIFTSPENEKMAQIVETIKYHLNLQSANDDISTKTTFEKNETKEVFLENDVVPEVLKLLHIGNLLIKNNKANEESMIIFYNMKDIIMEILHKNLAKTNHLFYQRVPFIKRCSKCKAKADSLHRLDPSMSWEYHLSMLPKCNNDVEDINRSNVEQMVKWGNESFIFQIPLDKTTKWGLDITSLFTKQWIPEKDFRRDKEEIKYSLNEIIEKLKSLLPDVESYLLHIII